MHKVDKDRLKHSLVNSDQINELQCSIEDCKTSILDFKKAFAKYRSQCEPVHKEEVEEENC